MAVNLKIQGNFFVLYDATSSEDVFTSARSDVRFYQKSDGRDDYFYFRSIYGGYGGANFNYKFSDIIDDRTGSAFTSVDSLNEFLRQKTGDFFFNKVETNVTPYNEQLTAEKTTLIELKSIYGISDIRDRVTEVNIGTVTNDFREYNLNISAATDEARLTSRERGRYIPGKSAEYGIGFRLDTNSVTGDTEVKWGAINDTNGIYYGLDSTGLFVSILDDGTEITRIYQSSWNQDKLDGTGSSGETLDLTEGNIFQAQYTWYGYGIITFRVQLKTVDGMKLINVHNYIVDNQTSLNDPNLPLTAELKQTTATNTVNAYVGGRQFSILGSYTPNFRSTSDYVTGKTVGTDVIPLLSFKHKASYLAVSARLGNLNIITDNDLIVEVHLCDAADLTGESFTALTGIQTSETAFESDISATAITTANTDIIYRNIVKGGDRNTFGDSEFSDILVEVPEGKILSVTAKAINTSATVDMIVLIKEEW